MFNKLIGLLILLSITGCATKEISPSKSTTVDHTFAVNTAKKFLFNTSGCKIESGYLKNEGNYASAGSYGTLVATNGNGSGVIDQYHVSCGALPLGGKSSCVIQHIEGSGTFNDYGGVGCPNMKFNLINFRVF
jgi:hypothetical protein